MTSIPTPTDEKLEKNTQDTNEKTLNIISKKDFVTLNYNDLHLCVKKNTEIQSLISSIYSVELCINPQNPQTQNLQNPQSSDSQSQEKTQKTTYEIISNKKFDDFEALYDVLTKKYKYLNLEEIPSRYNITKKGDKRIKYFNYLLSSILRLVKNNSDIKLSVLSIIYNFCIESVRKEGKNNLEVYCPMREETMVKYFLKKNFLDEIDCNFNNYNGLNSSNSPRSVFSNKSEGEVINHTVFENSLIIEKNRKFFDWNDIYIKINKDISFKGYIKIAENCLFIHKSISINNYMIALPLYQIKYDLYRVDYYDKSKCKYIEAREIYDIFQINKRDTKNNFNLSGGDMGLHLRDFNSEFLIRLFHEYETVDFYLRFCKEKTLLSLNNFLEVLESSTFSTTPTLHISRIEETNFNIYGKLYIELQSLTIDTFNGQIFTKVLLEPYSFSSKTMIGNNHFEFNQIYLLPINNRFNSLKFEVYAHINNEGLIIKSKPQEKIFEVIINLPEILNNFFFPTDSIEFDMIKTCDFKDKEKNNLSNIKSAKLKVVIHNYSNMIALTMKNSNKKILEDMRLNKSDDDLDIRSLLKRTRKMIQFFKDLSRDYHYLFWFKYPIFSGLLMITFIICLINLDERYIVRSICLFFIVFILKFSSLYKKYCSYFFNKYIFWYKNPYDTESVYIKTKREIDEMEVKNPFFLVEKEESNIISTIVDPIRHIKEYKQTYLSVLFTFTNIVSSLEKFKNLFLWTDPLLSFYIICILGFVYLIIYRIELRYILMAVFMKKFIVGFFYYKRKHINNLEVGRIILEHCATEWSKENKLFKIPYTNTNQIDLDNIKLFEDRFKKSVKEKLETHSKIVISDELFNVAKSLGDIRNEFGKCKELIKIKKLSNLYRYTLNNRYIYVIPAEAEDIFYYFSQNIKSDFYILRHKDDDVDTSGEKTKIMDKIKNTIGGGGSNKGGLKSSGSGSNINVKTVSGKKKGSEIINVIGLSEGKGEETKTSN